MTDVLEDEEDDLSCMFPHLAPSTGYTRGCRCPARCWAWHERVEASYKDRRNKLKRDRRRMR